MVYAKELNILLYFVLLLFPKYYKVLSEDSAVNENEALLTETRPRPSSFVRRVLETHQLEETSSRKAKTRKAWLKDLRLYPVREWLIVEVRPTLFQTCSPT